MLSFAVSAAPFRLSRLRSSLLALGVLLIPLPSAALAHGDEDHGAAPAAALAAQPRITTHSEVYELVGILRDGRLGLYLDRAATNEPVTNAAIEVTIGDEVARAEPAPDGSYTVSSPRFAGHGSVELILNVTATSGDDLLVGTLTLPEKADASTPPPPGGWQARLEAWRAEGAAWVAASPAFDQVPPAVTVVTFAFGLCAGLLMNAGRLVPAAALAVVALLLITGTAFAHGDEDHGPTAKPAVTATDTPQRLPDGTLFVPKPVQRLLEVRTILTRPEKAQKAINLIGRVIADPNRAGLVQSINGGRVIAPEKGLVRLGQAVRRGDVLAQIEPALPQADRTTISERVGEIEQQLAMAETRLRRVRLLADRAIAPQTQVVDAEVEIEGLKRRREIVRQTRAEPELLRAPIDGVVANVAVTAGQVVQAQDVLVRIVDPKGLWIEALVYGEIDPAQVADASATASDGTPLKLAFQGFSRALQQQASVMQFAILDPSPAISVGQPVTVIARSGAPVEGILVPREAVVRGSNGETQVWRHTDPERFEARPVRVEPFDGTRVVLRAGVGQGERLVVRGAELVNQIR